MSGLHEEHLKSSICLKRLSIVIVMQLFATMILITFLAYLQIFSFKYFINRSENNRVKIQAIPPLRGDIVDRNNYILTQNVNSYEVVLYQNKNSRQTLNKIGNILSLDNKQLNKLKQTVDKNKYRSIIPILNNLEWKDLAKIESNTYRLNGIAIEDSFIRKYPYEEEFAHIIGYVANPSDSEIVSMSNIKRELLMHPNYRIGKNGLEKTLNNDLTGNAGSKKVEVNAFNVPVNLLEIKNPTQAENIKLTIDLDLQRYVYNLIKDKRASVIVMDTKTGEILAMVSTPSFKSNKFVEGVSQEYWNALLYDEKKPLINRSISATYPIGSIFKPIVAIAALENNWNEEVLLNCRGIGKFGARELRCWDKHGHGIINIIEAIQHSCNIFFATIGLYVGIDKIYEYGTKFGIGEYFNIGLDNFKVGIMPNREWKKQQYNDIWVKGDTINTSIGQGFLLANPLQMAVMVSRIANGGYPIKPFLIYNSKVRKENQELFFLQKTLATEKTMKIIHKGMNMVVNTKGGTAYWARIKKKGYEMAGKTGTAQVIHLDKKTEMEENSTEVLEKFQNHGIFIGFAPYNNPKYGIVVVVEHGKGGSIASAPIARDVLLFAQERNI